VIVSVICLSRLGLGRGGSGLALRQLLWVAGGIGALLGVVNFDYRSFVRAAPALYLGGLGLLITVVVLRRTGAGARRWTHSGPLTLQPPEHFKLICIFTLAWALTWRREAQPNSCGTRGWSVGLVAVPFVLVVRQPDLGTALVLLPVLAAVLVGVGVRLRILGG